MQELFKKVETCLNAGCFVSPLDFSLLECNEFYSLLVPANSRLLNSADLVLLSKMKDFACVEAHQDTIYVVFHIAKNYGNNA